MATATLLYRVDAGPLLSVSSTLAGGETISLTAASFAGWAASAALWEILDYPPGWPAPVGWSTDSVNGRYYYRASTGPSGVTPPDFTIPVPGPIWGKWLFRLTVNGAIFSAVLGVKTRSPTIDLDDLAYGESSQWGGAKQWPSDQKDNARKIDAAALAAAGTEHVVVDSATTAFPNGVPIRAMTAPLPLTRLLATSGATADVLDFVRDTGGSITNGDGAEVRLRISNGVGGFFTAGAISHEVVNKLVLGGPSTRLVFSTATGGTVYPGITLSGAGAVRFNGAAYASAGGRFVVDGSGNVTLQAITEAELRTAAAGLTGDLDVNARKVTNLADGTTASDAVTYGQLAAAVQGLSIKASVRAATTANIVLVGPQTVDGVLLVAFDEVLVKDQTTGSENGFYVVAVGAWTRRSDLAVGSHAAGVFVFVEEGAVNADSGWVCNTDESADVVGTDPLSFVQFSGAGQVVAGAGLTKTGNTLDVVAADASITVNADSIEASGNFVAKAISTSSSVTAGSAGLVAPKWDRASAGALTLGGTNATSVACSGLGIAKCVSVASDSSLALSSASGDASLDADAAHAAKLGTSTAGGVSIGRSAITVTTTSGGEVHALDDDKEIVTQWGSSSFVVTHSKTYTVAAGGTATPFTFNIPSSSSGSLLLEVEIVDRFNGRRASYVRRYSFSRIAAGASTFTAIGADVEYEDDATWNARATHVSPTITAETVGDAANGTQHFASWTIRYQTFTPTP